MFAKILAWIPLNLASVLGIVQGVIKLVKEILTAVINILFPLIPGEGNFEKIVIKVRDWVNTVDAWVEKLKGFFLKATA
jgi:hypothetical protein